MHRTLYFGHLVHKMYSIIWYEMSLKYNLGMYLRTYILTNLTCFTIHATGMPFCFTKPLKHTINSFSHSHESTRN